MGRKLLVQLRLTLWYSALLAGALMLFSASVYLLVGCSLTSNLDASLHQRIDQLMPLVDVSSDRIRMPPSREYPDSPYIPAVLLTPSGHPVGRNRPARCSHGCGAGRHCCRGGSARHRSEIPMLGPLLIEKNNRRVGYLLVWQSLDPIDQARQSLLLLFLCTGPALLLLAGLGGMLLARRALSPVAEITRTAASISPTDVQRRVPVGPADDELGRLAATFNAMIQRLEGAVGRERRFTADASHELRSPLSVILAEASLALEEPLDAAAYRAALVTIHDQAAGMRDSPCLKCWASRPAR